MTPLTLVNPLPLRIYTLLSPALYIHPFVSIYSFSACTLPYAIRLVELPPPFLFPFLSFLVTKRKNINLYIHFYMRTLCQVDNTQWREKKSKSR